MKFPLSNYYRNEEEAAWDQWDMWDDKGKKEVALKTRKYKQLVQQDHKCPICGDNLPDLDKAHWDHCHATGAQGLVLCHACNIGLGIFKDDPVKLRNAANEGKTKFFKGSPKLLRKAAFYLEMFR